MVESAEGTVSIVAEALERSLSMIAAGWALDDVWSFNKTMGRLADLYRFARSYAPIDEKRLVDLIYLYADYRLNGSAGTDNEDPTGLRWKAVTWGTFANELREIASFSEWCTSRYGHVPLALHEPTRLTKENRSYKNIMALQESTKRNFLSHLAARRQAWRDEFPTEHRPSLHHRPASRKGDGKNVVSEDFVRTLIERERNPVYKMFWIMAAWGSPRASEQLNLWTCDVLPPTWRRRLFYGDHFETAPLVVLAHPRDSTWVGNSSQFKTTRAQYLAAEYGGLRPRPACTNLPIGPYRLRVTHAGWKGMLLEVGDRAISQVYWTDVDMAWEYYRLAQTLLEFHRAHGISQRHPWLLVNTDPRKPDVLGRPLTMSNIEKAWVRIVERLGLNAHQAGRHIHGLRDFYVNYIKAKDGLHLPPETRKIMLHHIAMQSQYHYGSVQHGDVNDSIQRAMDLRGRTAR